MRASTIGALLTGGLLACAGASAPSPRCDAVRAPVDGVETLGDLWIGGFGPLDGAGALLRVDFAAGTSRLHPSEERAPLGIIRPRWIRAADGRERLHFSIDDGKHRRSFDLQRTAADTLQGTVADEKGAAIPAGLVRVVAYDRKAVDAVLGGTYAVDGDPRRLLFVDDGRLFDTRDGSDRRLYLLSGRRALVGAGVAIAHPSAGVASLDASGGLRVERDGVAAVVASRLEPKREEIRFASQGVMLQGTLLSPEGPGPHPAVVYVHGSGHSSRKDPWENAMARVLLTRGYATFLYDKRGVGDSGGEYVGPGGRETNNVSPQNLERLAADARAAIAVVAARREIDAARLGFLGLSQAGWIVPLAAKGNKSVRFVVVLSGAAVHTSVQLAYQSLVGPGEACLPLGEVARVVHDHAPRTGLDPAPAIAALEVPALWIYGAVDPLIPFQESMRILEPLTKSHDFTVKLAPSAGHELYVVRRDSDEERQVSPGFSPVALEALRTWLDEHVRAVPGSR